LSDQPPSSAPPFPFPQLCKCWKTGEADDLSLGMVSVLSTDIALGCACAFLQKDYVIVAANGVSLVLMIGILFFKLREIWGHPQRA
jgi:MtN3 and saliva related transmembrane protein